MGGLCSKVPPRQESDGLPVQKPGQLLSPDKQEGRRQSLRALTTLAELVESHEYQGTVLQHAAEQASGAQKRKSVSQFADKSQALIILDWDDTICPTSWVRTNRTAEIQRSKIANQAWHSAALPKTAAWQQPLQALTQVVLEVFARAKEVGEVVIVTNAREGWVARSCQQFIPGVAPALEGVQIEHTDALSHGLHKSDDKEVDGTEEEKMIMTLTECKRKVMQKVLTQFYSKYPGQSWKNVISVGDGEFERDAIMEVAEIRTRRRVRGGANEEQGKEVIRCKTIKMLEEPDCDLLQRQLQVIKALLPNLVSHDSDFHLDWANLYEDPHKIEEVRQVLGVPAVI